MIQKELLKGLTKEEVSLSREQHGINLLTPPKQTPWWRLYLDKFKDPIIIILLIATAISLVFGVLHNEYVESIGIIMAILLATGVGFWQEYSAKRKFDELKSDKDYEIVKVRRAGDVEEITKDKLVVGDVVLLNAGDEIPADIKLLSSTDLKVSESAMTGESIAVSKHPLSSEFKGAGFAPNLLLRGTTIEHGMGEGVVEKVGDHTEIGKTTQLATEKVAIKTPLERQLINLADKISKVAFIISTLMFIILNVQHWIGLEDAVSWQTILLTEIRFLMAAVVIIIVAVPEGLPLSVTLALAFSMKTMAKENNLIKKMNACETIGAIDIIFTDKTGTLTQNSMTVVDIAAQSDNKTMLELIGALNSSTNFGKGDETIGNPTEGAILKAIGQKQVKNIRSSYKTHFTIPFSSSTKYMITAVENPEGEQLLFIKGAPEVIAKIINRTDFLNTVAEQQARGRRAIAAAILHIKTTSSEEVKAALQKQTAIESTYIGTWFIEDPIRNDVPKAIEKCSRAGIDVIMMTGDNIKTASEIAKQAGLKDIWAIEAKEFMEAIKQPQYGRELPNVIARCTPSDKLTILKWTQEKGHICAMTGDGVNDSPTLNYADVGIAMGSGTSVAKEAADIILLDDAFPSIVTGVKWGRSLYKNIQNFLYLQLSINVSACMIAVFGPLVGVEMPFTVTQFLWINLVMDSLAAVALASEPADHRVLDEKPRDKSEFIINRSLAKAIFGFGGFIWAVSTFILWNMNHNSIDLLPKIDLTIFFAGYMMINWWNLFNARVVGKNKSIFSGLGNNPKFILVSLGILILTILIVQYGEELFKTHPLSLETWGYILLVTSPVVIGKEIWFLLFSKK